LGVGVRPAFGENTLQLLSTAFGFLLLGVVSLRWLRTAAPSATDEGFTITPRVRAALIALLLLTWGLLGLPQATPYLRHGLTPLALQEFLVRVLTAGSASCALALILFGLFWQKVEEGRPPDARGSATPR
jgi:hypothetical protein